MLGKLSAKYKSNDNVGAISFGENDYGGKSYGMYQLSSNLGVVKDFLDILATSVLAVPPNFLYIGRAIGRQLLSQPVGSDLFDEIWLDISKNECESFFFLQHEYIKCKYYDVAVEELKKHHFYMSHHSPVMEDVVWSRAVQYGPYEIVNMFTEALQFMPTTYPNIIYVDDSRFDWDLIHSVYEVCKMVEWNHGSQREALLRRFQEEQQNALIMLTEDKA